MKHVNWLVTAVSVATIVATAPAAGDTSVEDRQTRRAANLFTTTHVNMRSGPGTAHGKTAVVPTGQIVTVLGCIGGYAWCRVDWSGRRGWVYTKMLTRPRLDGRFRDYAQGLGVPIVDFVPETTPAAGNAVEPAGTQVIIQRTGTGRKADRLDGPASFAADPNGDLLGGDVGLQKSVGR
jgi:uncharacterized protein YraI